MFGNARDGAVARLPTQTVGGACGMSVVGSSYIPLLYSSCVEQGVTSSQLHIADILTPPVFLPATLRTRPTLRPVQAFPTILYAFPMCCVVWTWDSLFYGASDFLYNAKTVAVASFFGVLGALRVKSAWGHALFCSVISLVRSTRRSSVCLCP